MGAGTTPRPPGVGSMKSWSTAGEGWKPIPSISDGGGCAGAIRAAGRGSERGDRSASSVRSSWFIYVVYLAAGLSLVEFITRRVARGVVTRRRAFLSLVAIRPFVDGGCRENRPPRRRARPHPSLRALHAHPRRRGVVVSSAHAVARHRRRRRGAVRDVGVRRLHLPVPLLPPAHPRVQHLHRGRARRARGGGRRPLAPPPRPRRR